MMYLSYGNGEPIMTQYLFTNKSYTHVVEATGVAIARSFAREHIAHQGFGRMAYNGIVGHSVHAAYVYLWRIPRAWHPQTEERKRFDLAMAGSVPCVHCGNDMDVRTGTCFSVWYCSEDCVPRS